MTEDEAKTITVYYRNHRGEEAIRKIRPFHIWYGLSRWHPKEGPQWYLTALDVEKDALREFALCDMHPAGAPTP